MKNKNSRKKRAAGKKVEGYMEPYSASVSLAQAVTGTSFQWLLQNNMKEAHRALCRVLGGLMRVSSVVK